MRAIMKYLLPIFLILHINFASCINGDLESTLGHLKSYSNLPAQQDAAKDVIRRLIPDRVNDFTVKIDQNIGPEGRDTFHVFKTDNSDKVNIIASSGVAAAWGFHYYLKYFCGCHVSWDSDQIRLPNEFPLVNATITSPDRFRYYQNVCTTSYSFVWWDWKRWEREIDWMAMNGFNFVLAFTGQEAIWQRVYRQLNLTEKEIDEHFSGPAFLSWARMGNLRGWGGNLSEMWHASSLELQLNILNRMRELGITPVLPAFAGHVPRAFKRLFPEAKMSMMTKWNHFDDQFCCPYLLEPTEPLFRKVGNLFISEMIAEFGTNHAYNCDTFNEMTPRTNNLTYLSAVGAAIFQAITDIDPQAIWVLQGWFLTSDDGFWGLSQTEAFIRSVPQGRMIVLDLQSELLPQYERFHSYFGQPFIWCMLHNFGGTLGLYGAMDQVNNGVFSGRSMANSTMIGTGLTPEGINQNYVMYDLMNDLAYRTEPMNLTEWISTYAERRYGQIDQNADQAWQVLKASVYNFTGLLKVRGKYTICRKPSLKLRPWFWYEPADVFTAWEKLLLASNSLNQSENYKHDVVDVTRQSLQLLADGFYIRFVSAFKKKDNAMFQKNADQFLLVLKDLDLILASSKDFLLGTWLKAAKARAATPEERRLFEFNARNQITLWGPKEEINDYANKQWAGIVSNYFRPRWQLFIGALNESLVNKTIFNDKSTARRIFLEVELPFTQDQTVFPDYPQGCSVHIATDIHRRWKRHSKVWNDLRRFKIPFTPAKERKRSTQVEIGGKMNKSFDAEVISL